VSTIVASYTKLRPLNQGLKVNPSGLFPSLVKLMGSKVEGRLMQVNDLFRMELMAKCLGKQPAFLMQEFPIVSACCQQRCLTYHNLINFVLVR